MRSYYFIFSLLACLLFASCGKEAPPMEKSQLINILQDMHIAEALINGHHPAIMKDSLQKRYLSQVLDKWGSNKVEFEAVLNHMHGDPDYMRDIYESVQAQVNEYSQELDKADVLEREAKSTFKDSLQVK